jgi:glutathione synthase/RimK-type ligase-like ATP-grasp enzyme
MLIGVHKYTNMEPETIQFLDRYEKILDFNNISHISVDVNERSFWQQILKADLFIYRWIHMNYDSQIALTILPIVEKILKVKCLPDLTTCWSYDDKIRQYFLMKQGGFPIIDSYVFYNKNSAMVWIENADMPVVFKLKGGAGSSNVILINNRKEAKYLVRKMFSTGITPGKIPIKRACIKQDKNLYKNIRHIVGNFASLLGRENKYLQKHKNYILFQKYLPNNNYDTRVTVIGNRCYAFRRLNRENDFRSSGSGRLDYDIKNIDIECINIAFQISQKMKFQSMAYDFLYDEKGNRQFSEISYSYSDTCLYNCPGFWDSHFNWHEGHYWPQYFQLIDALNMPDLKQPDII